MIGFADRTVEALVLPDYADRLRAARQAAAAAGDKFLIGGNGQRGNRLNHLLYSKRRFAVPFDVTRGRYTWAATVAELAATHTGSTERLRQALNAMHDGGVL